jgi:plasmid stabilization system protein ParE
LTLPVLIRRAAELDLMGIEDWYERQRPGLGHEFREAVDHTISRVAGNPFAYPERYRGARRALLRRFPYVI